MVVLPPDQCYSCATLLSIVTALRVRATLSRRAACARQNWTRNVGRDGSPKVASRAGLWGLSRRLFHTLGALPLDEHSERFLQRFDQSLHPLGSGGPVNWSVVDGDD